MAVRRNLKKTTALLVDTSYKFFHACYEFYFNTSMSSCLEVKLQLLCTQNLSKVICKHTMIRIEEAHKKAQALWKDLKDEYAEPVGNTFKVLPQRHTIKQLI